MSTTVSEVMSQLQQQYDVALAGLGSCWGMAVAGGNQKESTSIQELISRVAEEKNHLLQLTPRMATSGRKGGSVSAMASDLMKRPVGRPRKNHTDVGVGVRRSPGRPRKNGDMQEVNNNFTPMDAYTPYLMVALLNHKGKERFRNIQEEMKNMMEQDGILKQTDQEITGTNTKRYLAQSSSLRQKFTRKGWVDKNEEGYWTLTEAGTPIARSYAREYKKAQQSNQTASEPNESPQEIPQESPPQIEAQQEVTNQE